VCGSCWLRPATTTIPTLRTEYLVALDADEPAFDIPHESQANQRVLGAVVPGESRIIRLRSPDDLQPLTLRRVEN